MDGRLDGATLRFGANRAKPPRGWALFTLRSVRRIFPAVQEVNCPEGARETTLGCAAAKNDIKHRDHMAEFPEYLHVSTVVSYQDSSLRTHSNAWYRHFTQLPSIYFSVGVKS